MKGIIWFIIGALLFVFMIVMTVITIVGFVKRKKLIENSVIKYKVNDKTAKLNLTYAIIFGVQIPLSLIRAMNSFDAGDILSVWGEVLFSVSIVVMCIMYVIIYSKTKTSYITDEGFIAADKMLSNADIKYVLSPENIELYYKENSRPIKLEMLENKEELIDMLIKNYNKYN